MTPRGIRELEEANAKLKKDLTTAVAMIEMLSLAVLKYRQFVLFSCKCDKQLLTAEDRFEQLAKACRFIQEKNGQEDENGEKSEESVSDLFDEDESSDENAGIIEERRAKEESSIKLEKESGKKGTKKKLKKSKSDVKVVETPELEQSGNKSLRMFWKLYQNDKHVEVETDSGPKIKCLECQHLYTTFDRFKFHYTAKHDKSTYIYNGKFQDFIDSSGQKQYQCLECLLIFKSHDSIRKHYKETHIIGKKVCPYVNCGKTFGWSISLKMHVERKHGVNKDKHLKKVKMNRYNKLPGKLACDFPGCNETLSSKWALKGHKETIHSDDAKIFECDWPGCDFKSKYKNSVALHAKSHTEGPQFSCHWPGCNKKYYDDSKVRHHVRTAHLKVRKFKCDWPNCEFQATSNFIVKKHMSKHTQERNYACTWPGCDKKYLSKSNLGTHMEVHKGIRPFKCKVPGCDKDFVYAGTLKIHVRLVHEKINNK